MRIGIVKEKYSRLSRQASYIGVTIFLLLTYPLLLQVNLSIGITWLLFSLICIASLIFVNKVIDDIIILGEVEIGHDSFSFSLKQETTIVHYKDIEMILLKPMFGGVRAPDIFKVYQCQIKTHDNVHSYQITREEIKNKKLIAKNIVNPKAFDFIDFLENKKINYRFGKQIH